MSVLSLELQGCCLRDHNGYGEQALRAVPSRPDEPTEALTLCLGRSSHSSVFSCLAVAYLTLFGLSRSGAPSDCRASPEPLPAQPRVWQRHNFGAGAPPEHRPVQHIPHHPVDEIPDTARSVFRSAGTLLLHLPREVAGYHSS